MKRILTLLLLAGLTAVLAQAKTYQVCSPDGKTVITVDAGKQLTWSATHKGQQIITPSALSMTVGGKTVGDRPSVRKARTEQVSGTVNAPFWRQARIEQRYNQLTLDLGGGWSVVFRAYDGEGVAYRFVSTSVK